jgi:hypothetical protein
VCDIPLLFERNLADEFDVVVLVDAPREVRLERLVRDRDLSATDAMAMIAAQMPAELKRARADVVIDNDRTPAALAERVTSVWAQIERRAAETTAERVAHRADRVTRGRRPAQPPVRRPTGPPNAPSNGAPNAPTTAGATARRGTARTATRAFLDSPRAPRLDCRANDPLSPAWSATWRTSRRTCSTRRSTST